MRPALVSVVIPAHNAEAHLRAALASALGQTYPRMEVLVVDDGSTDGTADLAAAVAARDPRVRLLRQDNRGVAAARNLGIAHARGTYIAPLDADDLWQPFKIAAQVRRFEEHGPRMGLVHTWSYAIDEAGRPRRPGPAWLEEGWLFEALLFVNFIGNASVPLIRRSCLEDVGGYDPSLRTRGGEGCEDWDLALRIAARYQVGLVRRYLSAYRKVDGSMSCNVRAMARSYELVMGRVTEEHPDLPPSLLRWSRANFYLYAAGTSYATGQYTQVPSMLGLALRADPAALLMPWTGATAAKSLVRHAFRPLFARLWPTKADWEAFRRRFRRPPRAGLDAAPWPSRHPYDRLRPRRWRRLTGDRMLPDALPPEGRAPLRSSGPREGADGVAPRALPAAGGAFRPYGGSRVRGEPSGGQP